MDDLFKVLTIVLKMKRSLTVGTTLIFIVSYSADTLMKMWLPVVLATHYELERYEYNGTIVVRKAASEKGKAVSAATKKTDRVKSGID